MTLKLEIAMDNAAFADYPEGETAKILRDVADLVINGRTDGHCIDVNGNTVGKWEIKQ